MIFAKLNNSERYATNPLFEKAFSFLKTLDENSEEKRYELDGDKLFAIVMSYDTKPIVADNVVLESHKKYIDIQMVLRGAEGIAWYHTDKLETKMEYDSEKDLIFYERTQEPIARVDVYPGHFCLLYPEDAHSPQLQVGDKIENIKKVVVKVAVER